MKNDFFFFPFFLVSDVAHERSESASDMKNDSHYNFTCKSAMDVRETRQLMEERTEGRK
jgi:hypothetical protein